MFTGLNMSDMETCYKVFTRAVKDGLRLTSERFGFEPEFTARVARMGVRIYEVPISYNGRTYAEGKKIGWSRRLRRDLVHPQVQPLGAVAAAAAISSHRRTRADASAVPSRWRPRGEVVLGERPERAGLDLEQGGIGRERNHRVPERPGELDGPGPARRDGRGFGDGAGVVEGEDGGPARQGEEELEASRPAWRCGRTYVPGWKTLSMRWIGSSSAGWTLRFARRRGEPAGRGERALERGGVEHPEPGHRPQPGYLPWM